MPKNIDDVYKKIEQSHKELTKDADAINKNIVSIDKNYQKLSKDITNIKQQITNINQKIDIILEIMNNFSIMLAEDEDQDDIEDRYDFDSGETWVPSEEDFWQDDDDI